MRRAGWLLLTAFAAAALLTLAAAGSASYRVVGDARPWGPTAPQVTPTVPTTTTRPSGGLPTAAPAARPLADLDADLLVRLAEIALGLALAALLLRWLRRQRLVRLAAPEEPPAAPARPTAAEVRDAVDARARAQLRRITEGSPREAILACWQAVEEAVSGSAGTATTRRWRSLTPSELAEAARRAFDLPPAPLAALAALYREARFSTHPLDEGHRTRAVAALEQLRDGLALRRDALPDPAGRTR